MFLYELSVAVILVMLHLPQATAALPTIQLGVCTVLKSPDTNIVEVGKSYMDAMYAATLAVNKSGGIHGRMIEIVEYEIFGNYDNIPGCINNFIANYPEMLTVMGALSDETLKSTTPIVQAAQMTQLAPFFSGAYPFDKSFIVSRADARLQLVSMLTKVVHEFHSKRIGIVISSGLGLGDEKVSQARYILQQLGRDLCGSFVVDAFESGFKWRNQS